jgi:preprotein translocase subunit SecG
MFNLKSITIFLTALFVGAALALQLLEMKEYNLFESLQQRFFPAKIETKADVKPDDATPGTPADAGQTEPKAEPAEDATAE